MLLVKNQLALEEKLDVLREADPVRRWYSLDDKRVCILCDRVISGRMIEVRRSSQGTHQLRCPTKGCPSTPRDWFYHRRCNNAPVKVFHSPASLLHIGVPVQP